MKKTARLILALASSCLMVGNAQADLDDGLVAHYPFNGNANDESVNNNHGTVHEATLTEDRFNNADSAYGFDGVNDYISVDDGSSFNFTNNLSLSLWVNPGSSQSNLYAGLIDKSHSHNSNNGIVKSWVIQQSGNRTNVFWFLYAYNNAYDALNTVALEANVWNHILVSKENGTVKFYKNGILLSENQTSVSSIETNGDLPLIIGSVNNWNRFFNGIIDDIHIYNRALSECEIKSLYTGKDECSPVNCSDNPATYSIEKNKSKLIIPFIDIPLLEPDTHQPTNEIGVFRGELNSKKGIFVDFKIVPNRLKFVSFTQTVDACHAVYSYQDKTLSIPFVKVGSEVYEATLKHLQEIPFDLGVFRLENYEFLHTLD